MSSYNVLSQEECIACGVDGSGYKDVGVFGMAEGPVDRSGRFSPTNFEVECRDVSVAFVSWWLSEL